MKRFLFVFLFLSGLVVVFAQDNIEQDVCDKKENTCIENTCVENTCVEMTVFIHGTASGRFYVSEVTNFFIGSWIEKLLKPGAYEKYKAKVLKIKKKIEKKSYYNNQPIGKLGLHSLDTKHLCSNNTSRLYEKVCDTVIPDSKSTLKFYTFTWSGALNAKKRLAATGILYPALLQEKQRLEKETGLPVKINLLAHSHGCNIVLRLAQLEEKQKKNLYIDKAVFLGGPVHSGTEKYIQSKIFGNKYVLYSTGDSVQVLDFVSSGKHKPRRTFGSDKKNPIDLPDNLWQIEILLGNHKPSHYALWCWENGKFSKYLYGKKNCFKPMPVSVFIPAITFLADQVDLKKYKNRSCILKFNIEKNKFYMFTKDKRQIVKQSVCIEDIKKEDVKK